MELKDIASVQMGYSFRARLEHLDSGDLAVIQMKDLTEQNWVDCGNLMRIDLGKLKEGHLVRKGDLIFRSRGLVTTAAILTRDPGRAVLAAPLLRIRATHQSITPEYLHWFINQPPAQTFLASHAKGTAQQMIGIDALEKLEIVVPPLERQKLIVEIAALAGQEQDLLKRISEKRKRYVSARLLEMTEGEEIR